MNLSPAAIQRASLGGMVGVLGLYGWTIRAWLKGPTTLNEMDRDLALRDKRKREAKRPVWEKKLMAYWRLGERVHNNGAKR